MLESLPFQVVGHRRTNLQTASSISRSQKTHIFCRNFHSSWHSSTDISIFVSGGHIDLISGKKACHTCNYFLVQLDLCKF